MVLKRLEMFFQGHMKHFKTKKKMVADLERKNKEIRKEKKDKEKENHYQVRRKKTS